MKIKFLNGDGEMSELIRSKDWSKTAIGSPETWPQSLQISLNILLNSKFPMFLWWGPQLICFYNDAYRPSLGINGKHPFILGMKAEEAWVEVWDIIKPLIDQVMEQAESVWHEDMLVPIYRNGAIEDVYWTFSYSPVFDDAEKVAGVLVTCTETTEKVIIKKQLEENERKLRLSILQAPLAIGIFRGPDHVTEIANSKALELWGRKEKDVLNKPILDVMPELADQGIKQLLDDVYETGNRFAAVELPVQILHGDQIETLYVNFSYEPLYDTQGKIDGIMTVGMDVTQQVMAHKKVEKNEEKLNIVITARELGVFEINLLTDEIESSGRLHEIFGYTKEEKLSHAALIGHLHPEDAQTRKTAFSEAYKSGVLYYESRIILRDKSLRWIEVKGKVFYQNNGEPHLIIGTLSDITDVKKHQQILADNERKFRLLADSMPQHIWTADPGGNLNYFNKSVFDYSGLTFEQINKDGWMQIVHPDDREGNAKTWHDSVVSGSDFLFEHRFRRFDGQYRWQLSRAVPQKDKEGNIQMWVGTSTDIHDIKELEQQKDYFISMASHELKTPVTSIKGYVQILQSVYKDKEDDFLKNTLKIIDKQVLVLTKLVTELLDLSRIKAGSLELSIEKFDLAELADEIIDEIKLINPGHTIDFSKECVMEVSADRQRISQVMINFLNNAIKYSPHSVCIRVRMVKDDREAKVIVQDYGIGISKADQQKIFERFYRAEGISEKTFPGFGIGLFIAAEIISRHGGNIGVESEPGKGSSFYFSLPLAAP
ncbi:MAG TPA: PAS domain-containing protein [Puia sp.]|nr:PAS domain-containing protein [Puia sp.]